MQTTTAGKTETQKRIKLGELKKQQWIWTEWMRDAVDTLENGDEVIAHYRFTPAGKTLVAITFDEYAQPLS